MLDLPALPQRAGGITLAQLIDLYMAHYAGRDSTRPKQLAWWSSRIGCRRLDELSDDDVHAALEALATSPARVYAGKDADGHRIYKAKDRPRAPATINRYASAISAVMTWSIKRRIAPRGYVHPCRAIEQRRENNGRTRFLSQAECDRLLQACKASRWPRMYLLALMAISTGARRGELMGLCWRDIALQLAVAKIDRSKNGDAKGLPLIPAVVEELRRFKGAPGEPVFVSTRHADKAFDFKQRWAEVLQEAKLRGVTFHTLRHTCASYLAQNGATLLEIGDLLGHRSIAMAKRYAHLANSHRSALVNRVLGDLR